MCGSYIDYCTGVYIFYFDEYLREIYMCYVSAALSEANAERLEKFDIPFQNNITHDVLISATL